MENIAISCSPVQFNPTCFIPLLDFVKSFQLGNGHKDDNGLLGASIRGSEGLVMRSWESANSGSIGKMQACMVDMCVCFIVRRVSGWSLFFSL